MNWGKPNRGLIIAATDLDSGDIPTACDTGRPKVTNSSVWAKNKQEKQEREGQQPALNSCPKTRSRGDAAQFFLCAYPISHLFTDGEGCTPNQRENKRNNRRMCYPVNQVLQADTRIARDIIYRRERPNNRETEG